MRLQVIVSDAEVQAQLEQQIGDFGAAVEKRPPNEMAQVSYRLSSVRGGGDHSRVAVELACCSQLIEAEKNK